MFATLIAAALCTLLLAALGPWAYSRARAPSRAISLERRGPATGPRTPGVLRIATYNIAHLRGQPEDNWAPTDEERDRRASDIAALLRELDADVVVLNEVDFDASWSGRVDAAAMLAERAGYPLVLRQRSLDVCVGWLCWRFGNAVLSRVELADAALIDLPELSPWETALAGKKRGALVTLALPSGPVRLAAVHLCHRSEEVRTASAAMLAPLADTSAPLIVAGDLNAAPRSFPKAEHTRDGWSAFRIFDERFQRRPAGDVPGASDLTYPTAAPDRVLDWILIPKEISFTSYRVMPSPHSDHVPVVADLLVVPGGGT
ncbi:MAG: endonuclease/exonuclease/phosphatase family protein [Deltaproteobacteria bacterium]|nr:endonuclease/exonuclease/phosphatase family protein [Deltaproteobacteria bacterium]